MRGNLIMKSTNFNAFLNELQDSSCRPASPQTPTPPIGESIPLLHTHTRSYSHTHPPIHPSTHPPTHPHTHTRFKYAALLPLAVALFAAPAHARGPAIPVLQVGHGANLNGLCFSHDGTSLLTVSNDGTGILWELPSGKVRAVLRGHSNWVQAAAYSPSGEWVATGSFDGVRLWNPATGIEKGALGPYPGVIHALAF